jgi:phenylpropionate dioxygenase-like ring-hydroxylating dioxygenase large terminal subunit
MLADERPEGVQAPVRRGSDAERLELLVGDGRVHRRFYTDPAVFGQELARIFRRAWLWLGHESQLRRPGDYFTTRMGMERVIVARHGDGRIHAFHNRCTHRGAEVCARPAGNAAHFECPYHAWTFGTDGALESVPLAAGYGAALEARRASLGLERVARVASYRGFLFGCMSGPDAPGAVDLETFLGPDVRAAFDNFVERAPDGTLELAGGRTVQRYRANWKLQIENSIDLLHPRILHRNAVEAADRLDFGGREPPIEWDVVRSNGLSLREWENMRIAALERGHCWMGGFITKAIDEAAAGGAPAGNAAPIEAGGWRDLQARYSAQLAAARGEAEAARILAFNRHNTIVYPNLFINPRLQQVRVLHPVAVDCTEQHGYVLRLGGAPEAMFEAAVRTLNTNNSPASIVTGEDHEVFERIQSALACGREQWVDWSRGLDDESELRRDAGDAQSRALTGTGTSEVPMRNQHRAWAAYMGAP